MILGFGIGMTGSRLYILKVVLPVVLSFNEFKDNNRCAFGKFCAFVTSASSDRCSIPDNFSPSFDFLVDIPFH
jgi:hypothetical protein